MFILGLGLLWLHRPVLGATDLLLLYFVVAVITVMLGCCFWFKDGRAEFVWTAKLTSDLRGALAPVFVVTIMGLCVDWAGQLAVASYLDASQVAYFSAAHL